MKKGPRKVLYGLAAIVILLAAGRLLLAIIAMTAAGGIVAGKLAACPPTPNCVCSYASDSDAEHSIQPLKIHGDRKTVIARLARVLEKVPGCKVIDSRDDYIHAECTSAILRFTDDLEFLTVAGRKRDPRTIGITRRILGPWPEPKPPRINPSAPG